ncbi:hypothetical protein V6N11_066055 [Hibiscus sabdariffa]|uniref:Uncharacterized protein n=2 Tax=Hibiscus sabdariffa TaxID=183260 RepID=A0ABR2B7D3_9ROSI
MLIERRQRRQTISTIPTEAHAAVTPPQGSRFNHIFMDDTAIDDFGHHPIPPADLSHVQPPNPTLILLTKEHVPPSPVAPLTAADKVARLKSKGKISQSVCKLPTVVLAPKSTNIMHRKSGLSFPSASRQPKGRIVSKIFLTLRNMGRWKYLPTRLL